MITLYTQQELLTFSTWLYPAKITTGGDLKTIWVRQKPKSTITTQNNDCETANQEDPNGVRQYSWCEGGKNHRETDFDQSSKLPTTIPSLRRAGHFAHDALTKLKV